MSELTAERIATKVGEELEGNILCPICMGILQDPQECVTQ